MMMCTHLHFQKQNSSDIDADRLGRVWVEFEYRLNPGRKAATASNELAEKVAATQGIIHFNMASFPFQLFFSAARENDHITLPPWEEMSNPTGRLTLTASLSLLQVVTLTASLSLLQVVTLTASLSLLQVVTLTASLSLLQVVTVTASLSLLQVVTLTASLSLLQVVTLTASLSLLQVVTLTPFFFPFFLPHTAVKLQEIGSELLKASSSSASLNLGVVGSDEYHTIVALRHHGSHWTTGLIPASHWLKPLGPVCMFQPYEQEALFSFARRHTMEFSSHNALLPANPNAKCVRLIGSKVLKCVFHDQASQAQLRSSIDALEQGRTNAKRAFAILNGGAGVVSRKCGKLIGDAAAHAHVIPSSHYRGGRGSFLYGAVSGVGCSLIGSESAEQNWPGRHGEGVRLDNRPAFLPADRSSPGPRRPFILSGPVLPPRSVPLGRSRWPIAAATHPLFLTQLRPLIIVQKGGGVGGGKTWSHASAKALPTRYSRGPLPARAFSLLLSVPFAATNGSTTTVEEMTEVKSEYTAARPRSRSEGAIRATLTRAPSASSLLKAVHDKVRTIEMNLRIKSLSRRAYILTGALSDIRPAKLVTMDGKSCIYRDTRIRANNDFTENVSLWTLLKEPEYIELSVSASEAEKHGGCKDDTVTRIKCAIAAKCMRALNWRAVFSLCCVYLWDFQRRKFEIEYACVLERVRGGGEPPPAAAPSPLMKVGAEAVRGVMQRASLCRRSGARLKGWAGQVRRPPAGNKSVHRSNPLLDQSRPYRHWVYVINLGGISDSIGNFSGSSLSSPSPRLNKWAVNVDKGDPAQFPMLPETQKWVAPLLPRRPEMWKSRETLGEFLRPEVEQFAVSAVWNRDVIKSRSWSRSENCVAWRRCLPQRREDDTFFFYVRSAARLLPVACRAKLRRRVGGCGTEREDRIIRENGGYGEGAEKRNTLLLES
ncbi:hypothetical protein PR048_006370 [Dryococelus australis]|uniref:Uncharacterized protein n=1 Tax=Dryococelus australis TaxID=614101 RepID=A0ABQ9IC44_9NEOP|nr:hypothetical protein PR048_006370 [Dryococelus australis]